MKTLRATAAVALTIALAYVASARDVVLRVSGDAVECISGCDGGQPEPTRTPIPAPTCPPGTIWTPFGCRPPPTPTRTPTPQPTPTPGRLTGGPFTGEWFPHGEVQMQLIGSQITYAADPQSEVAFCRKNARSPAPRVVWNLFAPIKWTDPLEAQYTAAHSYWSSRVEPYLRERLTQQPSCAKPDAVTMETMVASWATGYWGRNGFCQTTKPNGQCGTLRPVDKWPAVISPAHRELIKLWVTNGGGKIVFPPYLFSDVTAIKSNPRPQGGTWLDRAKVTEPWLFAIDYGWPPAPGTNVDAPTQQAWRVSKAALDRWLTKLAHEMLALGLELGRTIPYEVVVQISNGAYPSDGSQWQRLATRQICGILAAHELPCHVQVELFDTATSKPEADCALIKALRAAGAQVSAFDLSMAAQVWGKLATSECR